MFCNEHDKSYSFKAGPAAIATMAYVIANVKSRLEVPFGVDVLWDPIVAMGLAKAVGASFVREIFTNVYSGDICNSDIRISKSKNLVKIKPIIPYYHNMILRLKIIFYNNWRY